MEYSAIDFVMRGDSTEPPLLSLVQHIKAGATDFSGVPNLTWHWDGQTIVNPLSYVPRTLDEVDVPDYRYAMRSAMNSPAT